MPVHGQTAACDCGRTGCWEVAASTRGLGRRLQGTPLAGQIVMEGFIDIRLKPVLRRLVTRERCRQRVGLAVVDQFARGKPGVIAACNRSNMQVTHVFHGRGCKCGPATGIWQ